MCFYDDLNFGKTYEDLYISKLNCKEIIRPEGCFKDYDFEAIDENGEGVKYEIKSDRIAHRTHVLVFELTYKGNECGIITSKANYYIYYVVRANGHTCYKIPLKVVRKKVANHTKKVMKMGDGKHIVAALVSVEHFKKYIID